MVISSLSGGGAEKVLAGLANIYAARGVNVTVVTYNNPSKEPYVQKLAGNISVISHFLKPSKNPILKLVGHIRRYRRLKQTLIDKKPDVMLSFMTPTNLLNIASALFSNVRCVVSERTHPKRYSYGKICDILRYFFYRFADCVAVQTRSIAKWHYQHIKCNCVVVPNFLIRPPVVLNFNLQNRIVAVGRLNWQKGYDILIKAFATLAEEFPSWSLLILGTGPEYKALKILIKKHSLQNRVKLLGFVKKPGNILKKSSIAVQPSRLEGFPNALLEAMACGLPAIATPEAGAMLIKDRVNGLLVPVDSVEALAGALRELIKNQKLRKRLGSEAYKVRETYSMKKIIKTWDRVLFPDKLKNLKSLSDY